MENLGQYLSAYDQHLVKYNILPFINLDMPDLYKLRLTSRDIYREYLRRLNSQDFYDWASTRESWFEAVSNDDEFLMARLLRAFSAKRLRIEEYLGEEIDDGYAHPIYNYVVIDNLKKLNRYMDVDIQDLFVYSYEQGSTKVFSLLFNSPVTREGMRRTIDDDQDYYIYAIELSVSNREDLAELVLRYTDMSNRLFIALDLMTVEKGVEGARMVLDILVEKEISLSSEFINDIIDVIEEDTYEDVPREDLVLLYQSYPYTFDSQ